MGHGGSKVIGECAVVKGDEKVVIKRKHVKKIPPDMLVETLKVFNMSYNLISNIPLQLCQLQHLTELNLSHNCLTNKGIPPLTSLSSLCSLDLSNNLLTSLPDIFTCTSLRTLNLSYNRITSIPQDITKLLNLQSALFKSNKIDNLPDLEGLPLFILDLSSNCLKSLPKSINKLTSLQMLQLANNQITRIPSFKRHTNLTHLDVHNNRLHKIPHKLVYIVDAHTSKCRQEATRTTYGKLRELNLRDNKELHEIPQDLVILMRPPLSLFSSIPAEVVPKVFLGGLDSATNMPLLQHLNITHIVLAIGDMQPHFPKTFTYLTLHDAKDSASYDFSVHFDECSQFIEMGRAAGGVLVHCRAGISRSPTLVIAYMMKQHRMRFLDAQSLVCSKRIQALPNNGFREQLMRYEIKLFDMYAGERDVSHEDVPLAITADEEV
jgi:Leucine-rich repeat (LRR) protein